MQNRNDKIKKVKATLDSIEIFTSEQNKQIQSIKSEILMLSELCKKEADQFKIQFDNEWKNLASIQHTLKVINTNLLLLNKKTELSDTFIADIYSRLTDLSHAIEDTLDLTQEHSNL